MRRPPALVPELSVEDLDRSLAFWCGVCGFVVDHTRPEEGFARIGLDGAVVMLDQLGVGRDWVTARLERPLGRGVNLEIRVADVDSVRERVRAAGIEPFLELETKSYAVPGGVARVRQFLVQDPDGYLLRFQSAHDGAEPPPAATRA